MEEQINIDGYKNLAAAVVEQAIKDYRSALKRIRRHPDDANAIRIISDCERFFRNEISLYSDLDGESIIRIVREKVEKELK